MKRKKSILKKRRTLKSKIRHVLSGINLSDMTTAERQISRLVDFDK